MAPQRRRQTSLLGGIANMPRHGRLRLVVPPPGIIVSSAMSGFESHGGASQSPYPVMIRNSPSEL